MKKLLYILFLLPAMALAQTPSQDQNYIKTWVYRDSVQVRDESKANMQVTYVDGLGRPIQQIAGKASGTGKDMVTHIEYDKYNRQPREYLPFESSGTGLQFDASAKANTNTFYSDVVYENTPNPYSQKLLEASPLGRVLKQSSPGAAWQLDSITNTDHTIKFDYKANGENEVKKLRAHATWNNSTKLYDIAFIDEGSAAPGQYYKTITKDENWTSGLNNTTEEFKNREGQVVLKRTYNNAVKHDTYYVYDQFGNLTYVLPPLAEGQLDEGLCYYYKYDGRNRMVEKKLPGKGWEYIVYDGLDRVVATGPALSPWGIPNQQGWLYTYYETSNRVAFTGWMPAGAIDSAARSTLQGQNTSSVNYSRGTTPEKIDDIYQGYNVKDKLPPTGFKLLTISYYDAYGWPGGPGFPGTTSAIDGQRLLRTCRGLALGSWVRVLTAPDEILGETTFMNFDRMGRVIKTNTKNYLGGMTNSITKLDFDGTTLYTYTSHERTEADVQIDVREEFTYTPEDRLHKHTHKINSLAPQLLSLNTYDKLGQLVSKKVGGEDLTGAVALQKVDYSYNIRGWLKGINNIDDLTPDTSENDLFAFKINYNDAITEDVNNNVKELYNGNIAETYWRSGSDNIKRKYGYKYDNLNRLLNAYYQKPGNVNPVTNSYNESLSYDKNGNITFLQRTGDYDDNVQPITIDDLVYTYDTTNKNQLLKVSDELTNNPSGFKDSPDNTDDDYTYDAYGNMTSDRNKGITSIKYNHLNLPVEIIFNNDTIKKIKYLYTAAGVKRAKFVITPPTRTGLPPVTVQTDYFDGYQYAKGGLQYFPTAEGYVDQVKLFETNVNVYSYVFQYKDHLGNARLNYAWDPKNEQIKIKEENHYYPFGLKHSNYNSDYLEFQEELQGDISVVTLNFPNATPFYKAPYNYKYNGKEYQDELGLSMYDYGARNYDPAIGRWMNIDPMSEKMFNHSPYNYALNNPMFFVDPDGALPWPVHIRSFISASSVAGGTFRGDGRGPSTQSSPRATSRVETSFTVDPSKGSVSKPISRSDATVFYGAPIPGSTSRIPPMVETPEPSSSIGNITKAKNAVSLDFAHSAQDPITPSAFTPDLDVQASLDFVENLDAGLLSVTGRFTGDAFPSTEAFITDQSGKTSLLLGAHKEVGGLGNLFGENKRETFTVNMMINIDKNGNFTGVTQGDKTYTVSEWNEHIKKTFK